MKTLTLLILLIATQAFAQKKHFADSAYSVVTIDRDTVDGYEQTLTRRTTQSYHQQVYWEDIHSDHPVDLLISERNVQEYYSGAEGEMGWIALTGKISDKGQFDKTLWHDSIEANIINYNYEYFESVLYGCCASLEAHQLFRYLDGKPMLRLTSPLYTVDIPNTQQKRLIGFLDNSAAQGYEDCNDSMMAGVLTYVDTKTLARQRLVINFKDAQLYDSLGVEMFTKIGFSPSQPKDIENKRNDADLTLWSVDGIDNPNGFSNFTIDIYLTDDKSLMVKVPVKNDKLDISRMKSKYFTFSLR